MQYTDRRKFVPIVLLSLFFSHETGSAGSKIVLLGGFILLAVASTIAIRGLKRWTRLLEAILGAFLAGAILKLIDSDKVMTHPEFQQKLEAVGFGVFIPTFFIVDEPA